MKRTVQFMLYTFAAAILISSTALLSPARTATRDEGFNVKEYQDFHDVLHPLQHEALPNNDFKRIRAKAALLAALGDAIVKLGVPRGVDEKSAVGFKEGLRKFDEALVKFKQDASGGTDDQLKESYLSVHDSFEVLAEMLPKRSNS
jgi:hypothetical protein